MPHSPSKSLPPSRAPLRTPHTTLLTLAHLPHCTATPDLACRPHYLPKQPGATLNANVQTPTVANLVAVPLLCHLASYNPTAPVSPSGSLLYSPHQFCCASLALLAPSCSPRHATLTSCTLSCADFPPCYPCHFVHLTRTSTCSNLAARHATWCCGDSTNATDTFFLNRYISMHTCTEYIGVNRFVVSCQSMLAVDLYEYSRQ